jgi:glucose-1-phosphate thymidylyltransferase
MIHVVEVEDPRAFGVAVVEDGWVVDMEEKPENPRSNLAIVGIDFMKPQIFEAIPRIAPSARGELEITDALFELTRMGFRVYAHELDGFWYDTGTFADLIDVLKPVMDGMSRRIAEGSIEGCKTTGTVNHYAGASVVDCEIIGPVIVGRGARARNCTLGPYVALGEEADVRDCELSGVQVYPYTSLSGGRLEQAIVSGEVTIHRDSEPFR